MFSNFPVSGPLVNCKKCIFSRYSFGQGLGLPCLDINKPESLQIKQKYESWPMSTDLGLTDQKYYARHNNQEKREHCENIL